MPHIKIPEKDWDVLVQHLLAIRESVTKNTGSVESKPETGIKDTITEFHEKQKKLLETKGDADSKISQETIDTLTSIGFGVNEINKQLSKHFFSVEKYATELNKLTEENNAKLGKLGSDKTKKPGMLASLLSAPSRLKDKLSDVGTGIKEKWNAASYVVSNPSEFLGIKSASRQKEIERGTKDLSKTEKSMYANIDLKRRLSEGSGAKENEKEIKALEDKIGELEKKHKEKRERLAVVYAKEKLHQLSLDQPDVYGPKGFFGLRKDAGIEKRRKIYEEGDAANLREGYDVDLKDLKTGAESGLTLEAIKRNRQYRVTQDFNKQYKKPSEYRHTGTPLREARIERAIKLREAKSGIKGSGYGGIQGSANGEVTLLDTKVPTYAGNTPLTLFQHIAYMSMGINNINETLKKMGGIKGSVDEGKGSGIFDKIKGFLTGTVTAWVLSKWSAIKQGVKTGFSKAGSLLKTGFSKAGSLLKTGFSKVGSLLKTGFSKAGSLLKTGFSKAKIGGAVIKKVGGGVLKKGAMYAGGALVGGAASTALALGSSLLTGMQIGEMINKRIGTGETAEGVIRERWAKGKQKKVDEARRRENFKKRMHYLNEKELDLAAKGKTDDPRYKAAMAKRAAQVESLKLADSVKQQNIPLRTAAQSNTLDPQKEMKISRDSLDYMVAGITSGIEKSGREGSRKISSTFVDALNGNIG